ncbi:MAG: hypothetical protein AAFZ07_12455 [Actinomycetota bacterium]
MTESTSHRSSGSFVAAAILTACGVFIVAWFLIGDVSEVPESRNPDRMVEAPDLPADADAVIVVAAITALVAVWVRYVSADSRHRVRRPRALVPVALLGAYLALLGRVITAGTVGVSIGGGLMLIFVTPVVVPALLVTTAVMALRQPGVSAPEPPV